MVSIHATLAGGDKRTPRPPAGGRVSIHATLAGGDAARAFFIARTALFLSTPPSRVATFAGLSDVPNIAVSIHATLAGGDSRWEK